MRSSFGKALIALAAGIALILAAPLCSDLADPDIAPLKSALKFANRLDEKSEKALRAIGFIQKEIYRTNAQHTMYTQSRYLQELRDKHHIQLFVFRNDDLILWSNNALSPLSAKRAAAMGREIHRFENGWYRLLYLSDGIEEYVAAIALKYHYPYENQHLSNGFTSAFADKGLLSIDTKAQKGAVKLKADHQYFYLTYDSGPAATQHAPVVFLLLSIAGSLLVLLGCASLLLRLLRIDIHPLWVLLCSIVVFGGLRAWSIQAGWPSYVSRMDWFSPSVYASSSWFPSLGDLLLNLLLIVVLSAGVRYVLILPRWKKPRYWRLKYWLIPAGLLLYSLWINQAMKGLVINSSIPFDINVVTSLNGFSLGGILAAAMAYFSYFLLADALIVYAVAKGARTNELILPVLLWGIVHTVASHLLSIKDLAFVFWPLAILLILIVARSSRRPGLLRLSNIVALIAIFAGVAAHNFNKYTTKREHNQRRILSEKLVNNDDPIAELLFANLHQELIRDTDVEQVFKENELHDRSVLEGYILQRYFSGYWGNYDIEIYPFLADSSAWGRMSAVRPAPFNDFLKTVEKWGEPTSADATLYYLADQEERTSYVAIMPLHYNLLPTPDGHLVIVIKTRPFGRTFGFPELLVDAKTNATWRSTVNYATARYKNGTLRSSSGAYNYRRASSVFLKLEDYPSFVIQNGFEHYVSKAGPEAITVISKRTPSVVDRATVFSYLCAIFGLLFILGQVLRERWHSGPSKSLNLNQKIQVLLVAITLLSMVLFAWATMFYIERNYTEKNRGLVGEKMLSITREVQSKLDQEESIDISMTDHISNMLSKLSFVYFTDVHLFTPEGDLVASSQMRMFNEGLVSRKMDPEAYAAMNHIQLTSFLHEERIGALEYISGYAPFFNRNGDLLGYVNLPYFARQEELQREIGSFLETVINVFVLLFILSIVVGLFIVQFITAPLRLIRESLSKVELGRANRIIGYSANDEIGSLVTEYNAKVSELEANAEKLARSERESAWRQMAKQVAHEIKNPLTPMKLNVQYLERSLQKGEQLDAEQIKRLSANLIEQIDTLAGIANAFSDFAKMPGTQLQKVDLSNVLLNTSTLYSKFENVTVSLDLNGHEHAYVSSDKEQLIRVFNNLIKNAIQSIPEGRKGAVDISISAPETGGYEVCVHDNGRGVDPQVQDRIFLPNFTTKTRGMGLGLAMSRSIVENSKGKIWFESTPGKGSRFYVWLPSWQA